MDKAKLVLKEIFGYDSFRPLQHDIIENILKKKDTLVIMPTGGGKSLCYQIPALLFDGLTVVISPLISLMKDQVEQLRQLGVETALLNSSLSQQVYNRNFAAVRNGTAKLLYLAPESFAKEEIVALLQSVKLDCITVDEAHCISEWGHDFRPEYRQLGTLRKKFPNAVCVGLTATATPRVQEDIVKNLNIPKAGRFLASFNRDNLFLQVLPKQDAFGQTLRFLQEHPQQSGIIYCFSRKQVDSLTEDLAGRGFSCLPYHAGLGDAERNNNQELFIKDEVQIIIATVAFGMGINKSNVRFVIHYDLPKNIESYYQEIGRAGRDGLRADCLLLFNYADTVKINYFIEQRDDPLLRESAKMHLDAIVKYAEYDGCRRVPLISYFGEDYHAQSCDMCDNCLTDPKDLSDITIPAQKFLSAVKKTGEIFGANYIIDVLSGASLDKIFSNGHQNLSVYGIGKEFAKKQWHFLAQQLVRKEILFREPEYGSLKLTRKAYAVLLEGEKVYGLVREAEIAKEKLTSRDRSKQYNSALFELLRRKRKEIADSMNIPPFVIFSDTTLTTMATTYPQTKNELNMISGVGAVKLERYGAAFLTVILKYCKEHNIRPQKKPEPKPVPSIVKPKPKPRHIEVGELFQSGMSIDAIAARNKVQAQTIIAHLVKYVLEGKKIRLEGLFEKVSASPKLQKEILSEFKINPPERLAEYYEKYNGEVSFTDLHLLRLAFLSTQNY